MQFTTWVLQFQVQFVGISWLIILVTINYSPYCNHLCISHAYVQVPPTL